MNTKTTRLTKALESQVRFANFAANYGIEPHTLGVLCQLVRRRAALAVRI